MSSKVLKMMLKWFGNVQDVFPEKSFFVSGDDTLYGILTSRITKIIKGLSVDSKDNTK